MSGACWSNVKTEICLLIKRHTWIYHTPCDMLFMDPTITVNWVITMPTLSSLAAQQDNLWYHQWQQSWHHGNSQVLVIARTVSTRCVEDIMYSQDSAPGGHLHINSSPPSAAYMHQWTGSALVQIMACLLFINKPLPGPMLPYCQLDP